MWSWCCCRKKPRSAKKYKPFLPTLYDPEGCLSLQRFQPIIKGSKCIFARAARLWGSSDYDMSMTLEENVLQNVAPWLLQMLRRGERERIDGFVFEIRTSNSAGPNHGNLDSYNELLARTLRCIASIDLVNTSNNYDGSTDLIYARNNSTKTLINEKTRLLVFAGYQLFSTTFPPCSNTSSSRYTHDADKNSIFILFQPNYSFERHCRSRNGGFMEWRRVAAIRDRVRQLFANAGQQYI